MNIKHIIYIGVLKTQRSLENFKIGGQKMPALLIKAFAILKKCAASVNPELDGLQSEIARVIIDSASKILTGEFNEHFPFGSMAKRIRYSN